MAHTPLFPRPSAAPPSYAGTPQRCAYCDGAALLLRGGTGTEPARLRLGAVVCCCVEVGQAQGVVLGTKTKELCKRGGLFRDKQERPKPGPPHTQQHAGGGGRMRMAEEDSPRGRPRQPPRHATPSVQLAWLTYCGAAGSCHTAFTPSPLPTTPKTHTHTNTCRHTPPATWYAPLGHRRRPAALGEGGASCRVRVSEIRRRTR